MNDKITEYESPIRIIALDLDYTTLTGMSGLSPHTEENLLRALREGIHVVVATGRGLRTIPSCMMELEGARFYITANGAKIWDSMAGEVGPSGEPEGAFIYSNMIAPEAVEQILAFLKEKGYYFEVFIDGHGYVFRVYSLIIIIGALLLCCPFSLQKINGVQSDGFNNKNFNFLQALFIACSGFSNTGLTPVTIFKYFN